MPTSGYLKERYQQLPRYIDLADRYTQKIAASAYQNTRLLSNEVLSRNPHTNQFFKKLLFEEKPRAANPLLLLWRVAHYYALSFAHFAVFKLTFVLQRLVFRSKAKSPARGQDPLYLVDTFVLAEKLPDEKQFVDHYFGGIYPALQKYKKPYLLLPRLYGRVNPWTIRRIWNTLRASGHPFVTEFELLGWSDLFRVAGFILAYPIDVLRLAMSLPGQDVIDRLFSAELLSSLSQVNYPQYIRYLTGLRAGQQYTGPLVLLSWHENQTVDKNLYKGIRESAPKTFIWGCQFFIGYAPLINAQDAALEKPFGVVPDVVLVNGPAYAKSNTAAETRPGVSMRYPGVFNRSIQWQAKQNTVLFLSYLKQLNKDIVSLTAGVAAFREQSLIVHPHPANRKRDYPPMPAAWQLSDRDHYDLLASAAVIITSESSAAVEAAALGTSVVIVASQDSFTCNPMLPLGQGEIWDIAFDSAEIETLHQRLLAFRSRHPERIRELAEAYKAQCFVEPTEDRIARVFQLS